MIERDQRKWFLCEKQFAVDTAQMIESTNELSGLETDIRRVCKRLKLILNVKKNKVLVEGRDSFAPQVEVSLNGDSFEVMSSFKYLVRCFGKDKGMQEEL